MAKSVENLKNEGDKVRRIGMLVRYGCFNRRQRRKKWRKLAICMADDVVCVEQTGDSQDKFVEGEMCE